MGVWDYVILGIILVAVVGALVFILKGKNGCSYGCEACPERDKCKKKRDL